MVVIMKSDKIRRFMCGVLAAQSIVAVFGDMKDEKGGGDTIPGDEFPMPEPTLDYKANFETFLAKYEIVSDDDIFETKYVEKGSIVNAWFEVNKESKSIGALIPFLNEILTKKKGSEVSVQLEDIMDLNIPHIFEFIGKYFDNLGKESKNEILKYENKVKRSKVLRTVDGPLLNGFQGGDSKGEDSKICGCLH